jgi:hypothetical protein
MKSNSDGIRSGKRFSYADKYTVVTLSTLNVVAPIDILRAGKDHTHCDAIKTLVPSPLRLRFSIVRQRSSRITVEVCHDGISHIIDSIVLEHLNADKNRDADKNDAQDDKEKLCLSPILPRSTQYLFPTDLPNRRPLDKLSSAFI